MGGRSRYSASTATTASDASQGNQVVQGAPPIGQGLVSCQITSAQLDAVACGGKAGNTFERDRRCHSRFRVRRRCIMPRAGVGHATPILSEMPHIPAQYASADAPFLLDLFVRSGSILDDSPDPGYDFNGRLRRAYESE